MHQWALQRAGSLSSGSSLPLFPRQGHRASGETWPKVGRVPPPDRRVKGGMGESFTLCGQRPGWSEYQGHLGDVRWSLFTGATP